MDFYFKSKYGNMMPFFKLNKITFHGRILQLNIFKMEINFNPLKFYALSIYILSIFDSSFLLAPPA